MITIEAVREAARAAGKDTVVAMVEHLERCEQTAQASERMPARARARAPESALTDVIADVRRVEEEARGLARNCGRVAIGMITRAEQDVARLCSPGTAYYLGRMGRSEAEIYRGQCTGRLQIWSRALNRLTAMPAVERKRALPPNGDVDDAVTKMMLQDMRLAHIPPEEAAEIVHLSRSGDVAAQLEKVAELESRAMEEAWAMGLLLAPATTASRMRRHLENPEELANEDKVLGEAMERADGRRMSTPRP